MAGIGAAGGSGPDDARARKPKLSSDDIEMR
jgi:hypothetical protein